MAKSIRLRQFKYFLTSQSAYVTDGEHGSPDWDENSSIKYITAEFIRPNYILDGEFKTISKDQNQRNIRASLREKDVLIYSVGAYAGFAAMAEPHLFPANIPRSVALVRLNHSSELLAEYLTVFLNSAFGAFQSNRLRAGNSQPVLALDKINQFVVPVLNKEFQAVIANIYGRAYEKRMWSKRLYAEAESLLLEELGLRDWQPTTQNTAVKSFKQSFLASGRLDAEYYYPEKLQMTDWLKRFSGKSVGYYVSSICELIDPTKSISKQLVRNYDLTDALQIFLDESESVPFYELGSTKKVFKRGDVVVSRLRSYLKEIAVVDTPENVNCVGSSEFIVLRPNEEIINAETLLVYLRSLPVQQILKWCQSGSNHPRFMEEDLLAIKLPDCILAMQDTFKDLIRQSIAGQRESKRLLQTAKRAVELAIERDEATALRWIDESLNGEVSDVN